MRIGKERTRRGSVGGNTMITTEQQQQFQQEGYCILPGVLAGRHLEALRAECQHGLDAIHTEMDRQGTDTLFISHRNRRYFIPWRSEHSRQLRDFVFSDLMAAVCRATLGDNAWLFLDQFVVKAAERGMKFGWHQDSGYIPFDHPPYLTCWIPLDDVTEANGTVYLLPYSQLGIRTRVTHISEPGTNDMVGYFGDLPGVPALVPAGSIVCFASTVFHRSGPNTTDQMRRVYLCQYSLSPIMLPDGSGAFSAHQEEFLRDGESVVAER